MSSMLGDCVSNATLMSRPILGAILPLHDVKYRAFHSKQCGLLRLRNDVFCERSSSWWSQTESNRRPPACKAGALPTELWPRTAAPAKRDWWAWEDLNFRPHAYQARALTN